MSAISWSLSSSTKISSSDSNELSGATSLLIFVKPFSLFLSPLLPLQQLFVFRNIWQTILVWSNRTSFVSLTLNKSKFLHWDLHLLWPSTVNVLLSCNHAAGQRNSEQITISHLQWRMP